MAKLKKQRKVRKHRGSKGCGGGFRQKRRGKGNNGGVGMSGTGKRSNQKMQYGQIKAREAGFDSYFGKQGMTSASTERKKNEVLNLRDIQKIYAGEKEINLAGYKILGEGEGFKATIKAESASESAIAKMEKAGGKIEVSATNNEDIATETSKVESKPAKKEKVAKK